MFDAYSLRHEIAALAAAVCWSVTGLLSATPAGHLGAVAFSRARQTIVTVVLALSVFLSGTWQGFGWNVVVPLLVSGIIGIFVGDSLLFGSLNRVGPRRAGILFALNAPMAVGLGWMSLGETLPLQALAGIALTVSGVMLAIMFGKRNGQSHHWENVKGPLWIGVGLGLGAALGQAIGSIIARPVMETGVDPLVASLVRIGSAAVCLNVVMQVPHATLKPQGKMTWKILGLTALTGVLAIGLGMTLMLYALSGGKVGIVSTLSATSPALILPLLWMTTGERPAAAAWAGALLVIGGMALMFAGRG
jgi:drug/metabolite transporter (DMT)-like permease